MEFKIFYISPSFTEEGIDNGGGRQGGGALAPGGNYQPREDSSGISTTFNLNVI